LSRAQQGEGAMPSGNSSSPIAPTFRLASLAQCRHKDCERGEMS